MKIRISDFREGIATEVAASYDPKQLELEFVDLRYLKPLTLEGVVEKGPTTLVFRGTTKSEIQQICGRCLRPAVRSLSQPFEFFYEIKGREFIDTLDDIREVLLLEHPLSFVCRQDCLGLCPECGVDRNEADCNCHVLPPSGDFFSSLKEIWPMRKRENAHGQS